jgi:uncharacterized CHY-type Zn-finger protein
MENEAIIIKGKPIDTETRCVHYHSPLDIIAIKFRCCNDYYPCYSCHAECAGHQAGTWKKDERDARAVFCGNCKKEMSIDAYLESDNQCPFCSSKFNPGCSRHHHLYFEM